MKGRNRRAHNVVPLRDSNSVDKADGGSENEEDGGGIHSSFSKSVRYG